MGYLQATASSPTTSVMMLMSHYITKQQQVGFKIMMSSGHGFKTCCTDFPGDSPELYIMMSYYITKQKSV